MHAQGTLGDFLLVQQEEEILAELRFAELVGRASIVASQLLNGGDRTLLGLGGNPASWSSSIRRLRAVIAILLFVLGTIFPKRPTVNRKMRGYSGVRKSGRKIGISTG